MTSYDEIKRWNRPKRPFDFCYEANSTSQSPKHSSSTVSCISSITFDDSSLLLCGIRSNSVVSPTIDQTCQIDDTNKIVEKALTLSQHVPMLNHLGGPADTVRIMGNNRRNAQQEKHSNGSLFSRITTGYIGSCNEENSISCCPPKEESIDDIVEVATIFTTETQDQRSIEVNVIMEDEGISDDPIDIGSSTFCDTKYEEISDISLPRISNILDPSDETNQTADQWRQVYDHNTGKTYYYNRRTREAAWVLPPDAILLKKTRDINMKSHEKYSHFPKDVSITTSSTRSEYMNHSEEFEKVKTERAREEHVLQETSNDLKIGYYVGPNQICKCGAEEMDPFHPIESPPMEMDIVTENDNVYCIFCGTHVTSPSALIEHMTNLCIHSQNCTKRRDAICSVLHETIETLYNSFPTSHECDDDQDEQDKENIPPGRKDAVFVDNDDSMLNDSDDEDMMMDSSTNRSFRLNSSCENNVCQLPSTCPFCARSFQGGSCLSGHLLKCNARKNSSRKRMMHQNGHTSKEASHARQYHGSPTKMQSLLSTGRQLPGHPKFEYATSWAVSKL